MLWPITWTISPFSTRADDEPTRVRFSTSIMPVDDQPEGDGGHGEAQHDHVRDVHEPISIAGTGIT
jgi:hypothetical protein